MSLLSPSICTAGFSVGPLSGSPSDNNGPQPNGWCGTIAEGDDSVTSSSPQETVATPGSTVSASDPILKKDSPSLLTEEYEDLNTPVADYVVRSLSRPALRMLWHQRLGHLNFRRLSVMHKFVKGMPEFSLPNALEECPVCLAAKLRKQPSGTATNNAINRLQPRNIDRLWFYGPEEP